ncbi:CRISPR-associated protein Csd1 [Clostridiales Family XIII bacterium PM5-7]
MSWMKRLCETYDNNAKFIADYSIEAPLCPLYHSTVKSQIEVTIKKDGSFQGATSDEAKIIIPVTEDSAGRAGSTVAPHGLSDQLSYVAGDLKDYAEEVKSQKANTERFAKYISALENWNKSEYSTQKIKSIYAYLSKATLTKNLIDSGILIANENGKISGAKYEKYVIRFNVLGDDPSETWKDKALIDAFQKFYMNQREQTATKDICYLSGKNGMTVRNHPKVSGNAKLISSNDTENFTFRGRFDDPEEAFSISYEASQKAHNALEWLIALQSDTIGGKDQRRTFICWSPSGKAVPSLRVIPGMDADGDNQPKTMSEYKGKIKRALNGHRVALENENVVIMAMEAATSGRLSITYYNELMGSDFIDRLENWYCTCAWEFTTFDGNGRPRQEVKTPLNNEIVKYAFGTQRGDKLEVNDKVGIMNYQRLVFCVLDNQPVPLDIVRAVCQNASTPQNYTRGTYQRILSTACALLAKYHNDQNKGVRIEMSLDKTNNDRSYLFGRLLAVYDVIEHFGLSQNERDRETNAFRMQSSFVQHPGRVESILEDAVKPYMAKLGKGSSEYYKKLLAEITDLFKPEDLLNRNKRLDDIYLVGYRLQRKELMSKKNDNEGEK